MKLGVVGLLPPWEQIDAEAARRVRSAGYHGVSIFFKSRWKPTWQPCAG